MSAGTAKSTEAENRSVGYLDVAVAAERIVERGKRPTIRGIQQELGRGSLSTIAPYLKQWKEGTDSLNGDTHGASPHVLAVVKQLVAVIDANRRTEITRLRQRVSELEAMLERSADADRS